AEALAEARALLELASAAGEAGAELAHVMRERVAGVSRALLAAGSVVLDVRVDDDVVVPGQEVTAEIELWNAGPFEVRAAPGRLEGSSFVVVSGPGEAAGASAAEEVTVPAGAVRTWRFRLRVQQESGSAYASEPYYLRRPMDGWIYRWPEDPALRAQPFNRPPLEGAVDVRLVIEERGGSRPAAVVPVRATVAATYRGEDRMVGELRRPILVVPRISVQARPRQLIWPLGAQAARTITVTVRSAAADPMAGSLRLELPAGWVSQPSERRFQLAAGGGTELSFDLRAPANAPVGEFPVRVIAQDEQGNSYTRGYALVDYPHVEPVPLFEDAVTTVKVFPVAVAQGRRIGYVMGAGDEVPEAIRQLGPEVEMIGPQMLEGGDFGRFAVIVIGVRAYEVRPDLASANARLLDYVRAGGVLLVQYNQYEYADGGFAPYPVKMQRPHDRITDETARVTILDPASPVFAEPNRITAADFDGWVQERSLYMLSDWDPAYSPQLEMADPGEPPKRGGLIVGRLGEGLYVYTGLAFFRQLPAGVQGAYRLFANLLSLDPSRWPARAGNGAR
ncbi:MAG: hypothetical protein HY701_04415, partial [Gemmatimonadetes bacterium]|nr:hypothetical protein [Gemmatimonadota bacterium]